jgi:hypothetical protein
MLGALDCLRGPQTRGAPWDFSHLVIWAVRPWLGQQCDKRNQNSELFLSIRYLVISNFRCLIQSLDCAQLLSAIQCLECASMPHFLFICQTTEADSGTLKWRWHHQPLFFLALTQPFLNQIQHINPFELVITSKMESIFKMAILRFPISPSEPCVFAIFKPTNFKLQKKKTHNTGGS